MRNLPFALFGAFCSAVVWADNASDKSFNVPGYGTLTETPMPPAMPGIDPDRRVQVEMPGTFTASSSALKPFTPVNINFGWLEIGALNEYGSANQSNWLIHDWPMKPGVQFNYLVPKRDGASPGEAALAVELESVFKALLSLRRGDKRNYLKSIRNGLYCELSATDIYIPYGNTADRGEVPKYSLWGALVRAGLAHPDGADAPVKPWRSDPRRKTVRWTHQALVRLLTNRYPYFYVERKDRLIDRTPYLSSGYGETPGRSYY